MTPIASPDVAAEYDRLAEHYDNYKAGDDYDAVAALILTIAAETAGRSPATLLDAGCGTGLSTIALATHGLRTVGLDVSPRAVEQAKDNAQRSGLPITFLAGDMRALPDLGTFDLITSIDDAVNYLLSTDELAAFLTSAGRLLRSDGVLIFDLNTLATYADSYTKDRVHEAGGTMFIWRGMCRADEIASGMTAYARLTVFRLRSESRWLRVDTEHVQRHFDLATVAQTARNCGLSVAGNYSIGQSCGAVAALPCASEDGHRKVFVALRHDTP